MRRLVWTETLDGWQCGRYQIELAAPLLWVLSRRPKRDVGGPVTTWEVVRTAGSLRELKRMAAELERSRERRRNLLTHIAVMILMIGLAVIGAISGSALVVPSVLALFVVCLRLLVIWIDSVMGSPWAFLSEHRQ